MELNELNKLIKLGYSQREIANELNVSHSCVRYWLKKYKIKTKNIKFQIITNCSLCGNPIHNNDRNRTKCQSCTTRIRRYRTKQKAVDLLGGKCNRCGWKGNLAAFEFHHLNDDKEFGIANISNKSWKSIEKEILKCELLCSNCYRIEHTKYNKDENFMNAVNSCNIKHRG